VTNPITDVAIGDLSGDGKKEVVFGTKATEPGGSLIPVQFPGGISDTNGVYAIGAVDSKTTTATGTGTAYFDSDPSELGNLSTIREADLPAAGKPQYTYPQGFFSFNITGLNNGQTCTVTVTLPTNAPVGTKWVKFQNGAWTVLPIGDDDGDNIITFQVTDGGTGDADGTQNGTIVEPGAPGYPRAVGGEVAGVNKLAVVAPWLVLAFALSVAGAILLLRRRRVDRAQD
jgi:hypothetical protein